MTYDFDKEKRLWEAAGPVQAVVQIIHGMAEHIDRYEGLARFLSQHGITVVGLNLRGHGRNAEPKGYFADRDGWNVLIADQHRLYEESKKACPGVPYIILGHSMGSFLAREYAIRYNSEFDMLILSGTGHYEKALCAAGLLLARLSPAAKAAKLVDKIAFTGNNKPFLPARTPFDWLSRDEKQVDLYVKDELCGFTFTGRAFADFFGGLKALCDTSRLEHIRKDLPVLLISGDRDPVGQMGEGVKKTAAEYENAGLQSVELRLYPQARHELFNELNRDAVMQDLLSNIQSRL